jgi:hypothetical protein
MSLMSRLTRPVTNMRRTITTTCVTDSRTAEVTLRRK